MRWSQTTMSVAIQMMCNGGSKTCDRLNKQGILTLPSNAIMKLRRYDFQDKQGVTEHLLVRLSNSLSNHRMVRNSPGDAMLCVKYDEYYARAGCVFNVNSMELLGLDSAFETADLLSPLYSYINDIADNKNVDKAILLKCSAKLILQTIVVDLGSDWTYVGPYWSSAKPMKSMQLYTHLIDEFLLGLCGLDLFVHVLMSDMS
eukprot:797781_1